MKRMAPRLQMLYPKWNLAMGKHLGKLQGNEESNYLGRCIGNRLWAGKSEFVAWRCVKIWVAQKWLLWKCARKRLITDCLDFFPFNQSIACRYSERSERVSSLFGWLKCFKYCISYLGAWCQIGIAVVFFLPKMFSRFCCSVSAGRLRRHDTNQQSFRILLSFPPGSQKVPEDLLVLQRNWHRWHMVFRSHRCYCLVFNKRPSSQRWMVTIPSWVYHMVKFTTCSSQAMVCN
jgi:hypothetical protein